jgi:hypothetical protein
VFLVAAPVGALVGAAIAGYDYVVNVLLWEQFTHLYPPAAGVVPAAHCGDVFDRFDVEFVPGGLVVDGR